MSVVNAPELETAAKVKPSLYPLRWIERTKLLKVVLVMGYWMYSAVFVWRMTAVSSLPELEGSIVVIWNLVMRSPDAPDEPVRELNSVMKDGEPAKGAALELVAPVKVVMD